MSQTPDLSGLDPALRRRIGVAVARGGEGAEWSRMPASLCGRGGPGWCFRSATATFILYDDGVAAGALPDPENDPAAAWELMVSERLWPQPVIEEDGSVREWFGNYHWARDDSNTYGYTAYVDSPNRAVVDAFLAKHRQSAGG